MHLLIFVEDGFAINCNTTPLKTGTASKLCTHKSLHVALRQAVMDHVGDCQSLTPDLFQLAVAHLHLWLLQRQLQLVTPATATSLVLNAAVRMLQTAASSAAELASQGHQLPHFEGMCWAARQKLDATAAARAQQAAAPFLLPPLDSAASPCGAGSYSCPRGLIPPQRSAREEGEGLAGARQRAAHNLSSLPISGSQHSGGCFLELLTLLRSPDMQRSCSNVAAQHALCTVERELFQRAVKGFADEAAITQQEVDALAELVDAYSSGTYMQCTINYQHTIVYR
jgi:hypothetical protein